ncbi:MAG: DNA-directed RNA polymerase subunit N [Candidatus ainarchaeum sp.]|nr:DNA-directed RNA polymerase subunit N [Candidatus ainarchaeum sp.]
MMVPVRCFSCGKVLASYYEDFAKRANAGESAEKILDEMGITRYCCRRMLLTQIDLIDEIMQYKT